MQPEMIAGRYRVVRKIGHGGMGAVWLCHDDVLGREVAVKQVGVLPGESAPDVARAVREARSSAALNHPNVVSIFDAVEDDGRTWLVMENVPGTTLAAMIHQEGRLDPARVASIGAQVADGLAAAHARGTVHRDVKPGNILVDGDVAKISDFGIARTEGDPQLTRTGMVIGTPLYFSPALARGADPTPADDVWALGATLYAAVEGRPPVEDRGNPIATLTAIAESRPTRPEHAGFLADAVGRMLDPDPGSRWSMADAAGALQRLADTHRPVGTLETTAPRATTPAGAVTTTHQTPAEPPGPPTGRRRSRRVLIAAALVLLLGGGGIAAAIALQPDDDGSPAASPHRSKKPTPSTATATATETATVTATPSPTSTPSPTGSTPVPADDPAQAVVDYYAMLPDDPEDAWNMLGPDARASSNGYDSYVAFWDGIDSLEVGDTSTDGDVVSVELTYNGTDSETRQLQVAPQGDGWIISEDLGT
ncbi:serine/threonine-protein kinase [Nocardioides sp.]|uniref:serine/threonine-protein kinase n=1 Tax=Nocardioides sp. TaxID=35761 RepID=UPI0037848777